MFLVVCFVFKNTVIYFYNLKELLCKDACYHLQRREDGLRDLTSIIIILLFLFYAI